jgi:hypothetical protein
VPWAMVSTATGASATGGGSLVPQAAKRTKERPSEGKEVRMIWGLGL